MSNDNATVVITEEGELYYTGYKASFEKSNSKLEKYHKKLPKGEIKYIEIGGDAIIAVMDDGKIYFEGKDNEYNFNSFNEEKLTFKCKERPDTEEEEIIDITVGKNFHMYITDKGKLYGAGSAILLPFEAANNDASYVKIELPEGIIPKKVVGSCSDESQQSVILLVDNQGKSELWSGGKSIFGLLGQGEEIIDSNEFK